MKLRTKMAVCMATVFIFFTVALFVALAGMQNATGKFKVFIEQDQAFLTAVTTVYSQGLQMGQALRNIVLDPANEKAYKNFANARDSFGEAHRNALKLAQSDPASAGVLRNIWLLEERQLQNQQKIIGLAKENQAGAIEALTREETPLWREIRAQLLEIIKAKAAAVEASKAQLAKETHDMLIVSLLLAALAIIVGVAVALWLTRNVMKQLGGEPDYAAGVASRIAAGDLTERIALNDSNTTSLLYAMKTMQESLASLVARVRAGTETIATASTQIAAGNQDLSSRTEEQASSLEETASSMEELTSTVKQNADNARQANQLAAAASEVAVKGGEVVAQVVDTMSSINESSRKIVDIIGVIDGIAFQTNILALNAAVEAARAGEQGRGFAVVASEVRNLAQRSAAAAKEIKTLIGDSVDKVDAGSRLVGAAGTTMDEVVNSVRRVTDIMGEITAASQEQSAGIEQVNQAIMQMDQVTQQNAALVEQAAAAAESMQDQAARLSEVVGTFKLGNDASPAPIARPAKLPVQKETGRVASRGRSVATAEASAGLVPRMRAVASGGGDQWEEF